jgi:hypothetical protein
MFPSPQGRIKYGKIEATPRSSMIEQGTHNRGVTSPELDKQGLPQNLLTGCKQWEGRQNVGPPFFISGPDAGNHSRTSDGSDVARSTARCVWFMAVWYGVRAPSLSSRPGRCDLSLQALIPDGKEGNQTTNYPRSSRENQSRPAGVCRTKGQVGS